jgi:hypothetical protein
MGALTAPSPIIPPRTAGGGDRRSMAGSIRYSKLDPVAIDDDNRQVFGGQLAELLGDDAPPVP